MMKFVNAFIVSAAAIEIMEEGFQLDAKPPMPDEIQPKPEYNLPALSEEALDIAAV